MKHFIYSLLIQFSVSFLTFITYVAFVVKAWLPSYVLSIFARSVSAVTTSEKVQLTRIVHYGLSNQRNMNSVRCS